MQINNASEQATISVAAKNLVEVFQELAGSEALTRALVSERIENYDRAQFWVSVYAACKEFEEAGSDGSCLTGTL